MRGRGGEAAEEGEEDDGWDATIRLVGYLFARTRGVQRAAGAVVQCIGSSGPVHLLLGHSRSVSECLSTFFAFVCSSTYQVSLLGVCSVSFGRGCSIVTAGGACAASPDALLYMLI